MNTSLQTFTLVCVYCFLVVIAEECEKPNELKAKEEYCWKAEVEIIDRIQFTSKSVLNFAKKKLGLEVEGENQPQKCEYYQCIFQQLKMFNSQGFPIYANIENWVEDYVIFQQAKSLIVQLNICNDALSNSTVSNTLYDGDAAASNTDNLEPLEKPQSKCEIAAEFMKCLAHQEGCPVFQYP